MLFIELSQYFQKIEETSSRLLMTELLSGLFEKTSADEIRDVCYLLQGRVAPLYEPIEFGMADKFMIRAIAMSCHVETGDVVREFRKHGDLGNAAQEIIKRESAHKKEKKELTIRDVFQFLQTITTTGGEGSQEKKISLVADLLQKSDPLSARYIIRIPLGKMRLGFSDMTILDSLSWMLVGDKSLRGQLEAAYTVRPDIGFLAKEVKQGGIPKQGHVHAVVGVPILSALCQRLPTADEMLEKMGEVSIEPKYDGVRVQIHWTETEVKTFSRNLEQTTVMFPELKDIEKELNAKSVILDCEAVGVDPKTGKILPFQETTTRKRKHDIAEALKSVPLRFYVFDILYKDGTELLHESLSTRRKILEKTIQNGKLLSISPHIVTKEPERIREYHAEQLTNGLEGVVVKKWDGVYESGRRSFNWVKFKETEGTTGKLTDTIDTVVMGYYFGEGKRNSFGIGAFLVGVKKGEHIVTVTKIGTGVSDDQWKQLLIRFEQIKEKNQPKEYTDVTKLLTPDVWLSPKIVVEIAGDDLTKSSTHGAEYAVRFPRLIRIREDKSVAQITTVHEIKTMFEQQIGIR